MANEKQPTMAGRVDSKFTIIKSLLAWALIVCNLRYQTHGSHKAFISAPSELQILKLTSIIRSNY